jgi:hypothetical protein
MPESPCAPENNPACGLIGALPVGCTPMPDLVVESCEPDTVAAGFPITLTITVKNRGTAAAGATKTQVRVDGEIKCDQIETPGLGPGETVQVYCAFDSIAREPMHPWQINSAPLGYLDARVRPSAICLRTMSTTVCGPTWSRFSASLYVGTTAMIASCGKSSSGTV